MATPTPTPAEPQTPAAQPAKVPPTTATPLSVLEADPNEDLRELIRRKRAKKLFSGFQINHVTLSDQVSGKVYWATCEDLSNPRRDYEIRLPKSIFQCRLVRREINFSSVHKMKNFRIDQLMFYKGHPIEEAKSEFGCVLPYSINNWLTTIKASSDAAYMPLHVLSGNLTIESKFFDDDILISTTKITLFYI